VDQVAAPRRSRVFLAPTLQPMSHSPQHLTAGPDGQARAPMAFEHTYDNRPQAGFCVPSQVEVASSEVTAGDHRRTAGCLEAKRLDPGQHALRRLSSGPTWISGLSVGALHGRPGRPLCPAGEGRAVVRGRPRVGRPARR
jgi:hypothetical protein